MRSDQVQGRSVSIRKFEISADLVKPSADAASTMWATVARLRRTSSLAEQQAERARGVPNSGFRLFGRIRIVLWTIRPNKNTNIVAGWAFWRCTCCSDIYHLLMSLANYGRACLAMTLSRSFVSHNQEVLARAAGTDWVKSFVDITSCTIDVQTNYSYSFWRHYSSEYEYTIRTTIRHRSEYEANIRYIPRESRCHGLKTGNVSKQTSTLDDLSDVIQPRLFSDSSVCCEMIPLDRNSRVWEWDNDSGWTWVPCHVQVVAYPNK